MKFDRIGRSSEFSTRINLTSDELKLSSQNIITINNKKKCGFDFLLLLLASETILQVIIFVNDLNKGGNGILTYVLFY